MQYWTSGLHKMRGISWLAADLLASQEGLCFMELILCTSGFSTWRLIQISNLLTLVNGSQSSVMCTWMLRRFQVLLKSTFMVIYYWSLIWMRNVTQKVLEKIKRRFLFSNFFSRQSCRLWDNVEISGRAQLATYGSIIWSMRCAC